MNSFFFQVTLLSAFILASCAPQNSSQVEQVTPQAVDANGYCTQSYIDEYNSMILKFRNLSEVLKDPSASDETQINEALSVKAKCDIFFKSYGGIFCVGSIDGVDTEVQSTQFEESCHIVAEALKGQ